MLQEAVRSFGLKLDNLLHRGITDPKTFHIMAFTAFLDASLSLKGRRRLYEGVLEKVKDLTGHTGARIAATRLVPYASAVIEEVKREVKGASIAEEGSTAWVIRDVASSIKREVDGVFVIDAFSVIEFATLLATCRRNGFMCELRRQVFVNPPGKTDFVKRQVGKGQVRGWLRDYASKLAEEVECGRNYEVYPLFDEALHWTVGDVVCFLEGEGGRNPFELVWEQILNFFHRLDVVPFTLLVTSDHGYNIFEENGILSVGHGGGEHALLGLDRVALFAVLKKRSGVWL